MRPNTLLQKNEHRLLSLMLLSLLAANWPGNSLPVSQGFLIAHFGFFLLWQPVLKQQQSVGLFQIAGLLGLIFSFIYWFNPWLNAFWYLLLLSLLSGRIFARGLSRLAYGLAVIDIVLGLVLLTLPSLFQLSAVSSSLQQPVHFFLLALPLPLLFMPSSETTTRSIDVVRGFVFVLLLSFLLMASILLSLVSGQHYLQALVISLALLSLFLLLAAFLWSPRGGFSGFARLWERYLLNLGGPFEQWILHIDALAAQPSLPPEKFLSAACRYLLLHHWVSGVRWQTEQETRLHGEQSTYRVGISNAPLQLELFTYNPVGPVLMLHAKLLLNVLAFYYRARLHEQMLIRQAHMQAIYETGSKLTHDVKNILQSTGTMTQIINDPDTEPAQVIAIIRKQMPLLSQRLNATLEKLRKPQPSQEHDEHRGSLFQWWRQLQQRYHDRAVHFNCTVDEDSDIPLDLFNTVSENLLENALNKASREPGLHIEISLQQKEQKLCLCVGDDGSEVDTDIAALLFNEVVPSRDGFGIGLYQCHTLARRHGYSLQLQENKPGQVLFCLLTRD